MICKYNVPVFLLASSLLPAKSLSTSFVKSSDSGGIATALTRDSTTGDLFVVGTTFLNSFWDMNDVTNNSTSLTSCFIASGNVKGEEFTRNTFDTPEMCYGSTVVLPPTGKLERVAVLLGTSNQNSNIATVYDNKILEDQYSIPKNQFPVAMTHDENDKVIVALYEYGTKELFLEDGLGNSKAHMYELLQYWDRLTVPGKMKKAKIRIAKISTRTGRFHFDKMIKTHDGQSTITGLHRLKHMNRFIIAGSTTGSGDPFGAYPQEKNDWDGYIAIYDSTTGELVFGGADHRIASIDGQDDFVHGVCSHREDLFIVGTTKGKVTGDKKGGAFVAKMNLNTREIEWITQLAPIRTGPQEINYDGVTCTSHHHHGVVIGGNILRTRSDEITRDAFLSRFDGNGTQLWMRHLDSSKISEKESDDFLVGLDLTTDGTGLTVLLNSRVTEKGENDIILVDVKMHNGMNDLSDINEVTFSVGDDYDYAVIKGTGSVGYGLLGWAMLIIGLGLGILSFVVHKNHKDKREKIRRDHMHDYENNLKKWMDDDEVFDYDKAGLLEKKSGAAGLMRASTANIRGNHVSFNHEFEDDDFTMAYKQRVFQKNFSAQVEDYGPSGEIL